jgi:hypothetical protein
MAFLVQAQSSSKLLGKIKHCDGIKFFAEREHWHSHCIGKKKPLWKPKIRPKPSKNLFGPKTSADGS